MSNITIPDEMCVEIGNARQCMEGEYLLAAIFVECCFYFIACGVRVKIIDWIRKILRGEKHSKPRIRQELLQEKQR